MDGKFPSNTVEPSAASLARRRRVRIGLVALGVVVVGLLLSPRFTFGPLHKGKPIRYWTDLACGPHGHRFQLEVKQIGSPAVPYLVVKLHTKDTWLRTTWMEMHEKLPDRLSGFVTELLPAYDVRSAAAECLAKIGPEAKNAIPDLIKLLTEDGSEAGYAISALGAIGPAANEVLPVLQKTLSNQSNILDRIDTAWAIWSIGGETNLVLKLCTQAISQPSDDGVALNAALALRQMGPAALPTAPLLVELLKDTTRSVETRGYAARALGTIDSTDETILAALKDGTKDTNLIVKANCAWSLWRLDSQYVLSAVPIIVDWIIDRKHRYPESKWEFTGFQEFAKADPKAAIPALNQLLNNDSRQVRQVAAEALRKIDSPANEPGTK